MGRGPGGGPGHAVGTESISWERLGVPLNKVNDYNQGDLGVFTETAAHVTGLWIIRQKKKNKLSQILHAGPGCRSGKHGQLLHQRCEKMKMLQNPRMHKMPEMMMRRMWSFSCVVNKHCCCSCLHPVVSRHPSSSCICSIYVSLWIQFHHNLQPFLRSRMLLCTCRSVILDTRLPPPRIQTAFPKFCKILKLYVFTRGIAQILPWLLCGLLAVGALGKDLLPWKKCLVWFVLFGFKGEK